MREKTKHWRNPAWAKSQHQRPFSVKGGTRCQKGCEPRMESTQLTTMYWPYAREMSHQEQQLTNHIARLSLAEWKDNAIQNGNFARAASKITYLGRLDNKNKPKHRQRQEKEFWQTSTSKHQLQANQDKEKPVTKCRHLTVGNTPGVPFSGYFASCIVRSRLPTQWQARVASNQHHPSQTDKPEPTSDAQERAGRQEHTHDSSSTGQRLKSLAIHGIAESEWHESIHKILLNFFQSSATTHTMP